MVGRCAFSTFDYTVGNRLSCGFARNQFIKQFIEISRQCKPKNVKDIVSNALKSFEAVGHFCSVRVSLDIDPA